MHEKKSVTPSERREALVSALVRELTDRAAPLSRAQVYETLDALAHCAALTIRSRSVRRCVEQVDFFVGAMDRHFRDVGMPTNFGVSLGLVEIQKVAAGDMAGAPCLDGCN